MKKVTSTLGIDDGLCDDDVEIGVKHERKGKKRQIEF